MGEAKLIYGELTNQIIAAAIEVHRELGPGLLESAHEACLHYLLLQRGITAQRQVELPVRFRGLNVDCGYRIDLLVEDRVIVEVKAVDKLAPIHDAQLLTYLPLSGKRVGLLINFNVEVLKNGIRRKVL